MLALLPRLSVAFVGLGDLWQGISRSHSQRYMELSVPIVGLLAKQCTNNGAFGKATPANNPRSLYVDAFIQGQRLFLWKRSCLFQAAGALVLNKPRLE